MIFKILFFQFSKTFEKPKNSKNTVVIYPIPENHQHDVYPGINLVEIINQKKEEKSRVRRDAAYHRKFFFLIDK